jgi:hypothetical protein
MEHGADRGETTARERGRTKAVNAKRKTTADIVLALTEAIADVQWFGRRWSAEVPSWKDDGGTKILTELTVTILDARDALAKESSHA